MRRPHGVRLLGRAVPAFALVAWLLVSVPAAAQVASLTVTPSTGLVAGQSIQLAGEGEATGFSVLGACDAATDYSSLNSAQLTCEIILFPFVGAFETNWTAKRVLTTPTGTIDCVMTPCVIAFGGLDGSTVTFVETVPITFQPAPLVTLAPTALGHLDSATLNVSGTAPTDSVAMIQCTLEVPLSAGSPPGACIEHGPAAAVAGGHAGSIASAPRWIDDTNGDLTDCAVSPSCRFGVRVTNNGVDTYVFGSGGFSTRLQTSITGPHDLSRVIVFESVHEKDVLDISIGNIDQFGPGIAVKICDGNLDIGPNLATCGSVGIPPIVGVTSFSGSLSIPVSFVGDNGVTYDCTLAGFDACFIVVLGYRDPGPSNPFVLATLAAFYDVEPRSFEALPTGGLLDGDAVTITASVGPHETGGAAVPAQCGFVTPDYAGFRCVAGSDVDLAFDGNYSGSITVQRQFVASGDTVDCSVMVCAVFLAVLGSDGIPIAIPGAAISFAPEP